MSRNEKLQVMVSADSSCSDSGLEVRGSRPHGAPLRALYRTPRVEAETESHTTDYSPSPQSSILDAPLPLPPTLVRIQQSNAVRYEEARATEV